MILNLLNSSQSSHCVVEVIGSNLGKFPATSWKESNRAIILGTCQGCKSPRLFGDFFGKTWHIHEFNIVIFQQNAGLYYKPQIVFKPLISIFNLFQSFRSLQFLHQFRIYWNHTRPQSREKPQWDIPISFHCLDRCTESDDIRFHGVVATQML